MSDHDPSGESGFFRDIFQTRYREVTISAVVFALVIGLIMNAAITYAGLKIGFTIGGSAIAAVLGFGVLRGIMGKGSILETNIAQTCASAINTSNSGIIFTFPVLLLLGIDLTWSDLDFWLIAVASVAGAILGAAFIIPLRKQMIDIDRLRFPTGTGVAVILKSPGAGPAKARVLVAGIALSALIYLPVALPEIGSPAEVAALDGLVESERVTAGAAKNTRMFAKWIAEKRAPSEVTERGKIADELAIARVELAATEDRAARKAMKQQVADIERRLQAAPAAAGVGDGMYRAAYQASIGKVEWDALRSTELGWAKHPLPGYKDLQFRMREVADAETKSGLAMHVDYDQNGRPDLLVDDHNVKVGRMLGLPDQFKLVFAIAPFALGAGYITGAAGLLVLAGGILAFFVLAPLGFSFGWFPQTILAHQAPGYAFGAFNRPLGIGLLLGGAMMGVAVALPAIKEALKSVAAAGKIKGGSDELSIKVVGGAIIGAVVLLFVAAQFVGNRPLNDICPVSGDEVWERVEPVQHQGYSIAFADEESKKVWLDTWTDEKRQEFMDSKNAKPGWLASLPPMLRALLIAIVGGLWIWFAGIIIAQCTGMTDWSPISGMALLTVVLVMLLSGTGAIVGAVLIGAALCVAITLAADMMQDLRTGHLLGAKPKRQQVMELLVVGIGPAVSMVVVLIIAQANLKSYGIALGPGTLTSAPQAQALQAVITGVQGGEMPYALYGFGALLGALLGLGSFSGLGVLVGLSMYLPFEYIATYGIGCVVQMFVSRVKGREWAEEWGVPFAAGLIVGESILALIINIIVLATG